ncbi:Repeat domain-containing protein [Mucilaginibacter pineti]|uniref:Repeat domain-containing protein n=1 Tax=Mucilaginibacter pineti TaxID=1391627 RepID=A0A1G7CY32_9SPHI|nr:VCBS repeat-containing protein [Mucilaginibacter pineti]SDE44242.1 Repeat domain-containing protein [Mucilaginibacter pineti]
MHRTIIIVIFFLGIVMIYWNCTNTKGHYSSEGEVLSKKYCTSCHAYPSPSLLNKQTWANHVLPAMGAFADLFKDKDGTYRKLTPEMAAQYRNPLFAHVRASIPTADWEKVVDFYLENAPDSLISPAVPITADSKQFDTSLPIKKSKAYTGLVYYDEKSKLLFQSNFKDSTLRIYDSSLQVKDSLIHCKGVVDVEPLNAVNTKGRTSFLVTHIGSFQPTVQKNGFVEQVDIQGGKIIHRKTLCDSVYRPVQSAMVDMDSDEKKDIVVCEFGYMSGQLSLFKNTGNGHYQKQTISTTAGAEKMYIEDINGDGLPDIWVLFAHDIEGVFQFINKGGGKFEQKQVLSFPPCYGSTYFELKDIDHDGQKEIIYTCGDNADYSQILKPYHGVYIFKKNAQGQFKQVYFFHVNGCYKAVSADFNQDGKPDLAVISFFADYEHQPQEGFLWLINQGGYKYKAFTDPAVTNKGRWICMDVKDMNGDHKPDIILGNMAAKPGKNRTLMLQWMNGPEILVLKSK